MLGEAAAEFGEVGGEASPEEVQAEQEAWWQEQVDDREVERRCLAEWCCPCGGEGECDWCADARP